MNRSGKKKSGMGTTFKTAMRYEKKQTVGVKTKGKSEAQAKRKEHLTQKSNVQTICVVCSENHDED